MKMRMDVQRLAERFSEVTGLSVEAVYLFLMDTGRSLSTHPRKLEFETGRGVLWLKGAYDKYRLERFERQTGFCCNDEESLYWEGRILARQDCT